MVRPSGDQKQPVDSGRVTTGRVPAGSASPGHTPGAHLGAARAAWVSVAVVIAIIAVPQVMTMTFPGPWRSGQWRECLPLGRGSCSDLITTWETRTGLCPAAAVTKLGLGVQGCTGKGGQ